MGFLDSVNLDDVTEPTAVPGGEEYKVRIVDVKVDSSNPTGLPHNKNGQPYLLPRFEIPEEPTAKEFTTYLGIPTDDMDPKAYNAAGFKLKNFLATFDLDASALSNPEDIKGAEGWAILGLEDSPEWGEQNYVKKFISPK